MKICQESVRRSLLLNKHKHLIINDLFFLHANTRMGTNIGTSEIVDNQWRRCVHFLAHLTLILYFVKHMNNEIDNEKRHKKREYQRQYMKQYREKYRPKKTFIGRNEIDRAIVDMRLRNVPVHSEEWNTTIERIKSRQEANRERQRAYFLANRERIRLRHNERLLRDPEYRARYQEVKKKANERQKFVRKTLVGPKKPRYCSESTLRRKAARAEKEKHQLLELDRNRKLLSSPSSENRRRALVWFKLFANPSSLRECNGNVYEMERIPAADGVNIQAEYLAAQPMQNESYNIMGAYGLSLTEKRGGYRYKVTLPEKILAEATTFLTRNKQ